MKAYVKNGTEEFADFVGVVVGLVVALFHG